MQVHCRSIGHMKQVHCRSIGHMKQKELNQFKVEKNWMQNRTLAKQKRTHEQILFGGGQVNSYEDALGQLFSKSILELKENDIYLDVGAGDGNALFEYRELFPKGASVIGIASTQPHNLSQVIEKDLNDDKFSFYLSDINNFPTESLKGRISLISDVKGAFRYGLYPHKVIEQFGKLLKTNALAFIEIGYGIGIKPDMIPQEKQYLNGRQESQGSKMLLHLWFQTLRGFDVIQHKMMFEKVENSIAFNKEIIVNPQKWDDQMRDDQLVILRRNEDPVEVEPLAYDTDFVEKWQPIENKLWDLWTPRYQWEMSEKSKELTKKINLVTQ
jgi:SAM-dependent methyltransferase